MARKIIQGSLEPAGCVASAPDLFAIPWIVSWDQDLNSHVFDQGPGFVIAQDLLGNLVYPGVIFFTKSSPLAFFLDEQRLAYDKVEAMLAEIAVKAIQVFAVVRHRHFHQEDALIIGYQFDTLDSTKGQQMAVCQKKHQGIRAIHRLDGARDHRKRALGYLQVWQF